MNLIGLTTEKRAELILRADDRLRPQVENALRGFDLISTHSLLRLVGIPRTTGNARRIAKIMRALDFVPVKSRRISQAGLADRVTRGWARANQGNPKQATQAVKYILLKGGIYDSLSIVHYDANAVVGGARPLPGGRFIVDNADCEEIDIVNSLDEIIPAIAAYYDANPPRWEFEPRPNFWHTDVKAYGPRYMNDSPFGPLIVFQIAPDQWVAFRNQCELLLGDEIATFTTLEEAQHKADAHERDGYPNSEIIDDGCSWIFCEYVDWRQNVHIVTNRAQLMVQTNTH